MPDSWDIMDDVVEKNIDLTDLEPTLDESELKQSIQEKVLSFFQREYNRLPENNKFRAKVLKYYAQNEEFVRKDSTVYSRKINDLLEEARKADIIVGSVREGPRQALTQIGLATRNPLGRLTGIGVSRTEAEQIMSGVRSYAQERNIRLGSQWG